MHRQSFWVLNHRFRDVKHRIASPFSRSTFLHHDIVTPGSHLLCLVILDDDINSAHQLIPIKPRLYHFRLGSVSSSPARIHAV
ncbi:hypothetical protein F5880DRAFT_1619583 [Lentinula raphanica]|nr:hypothetical protein F5880DRAFT_1619583 [Lentinula raphanica]